MMTDFLPAVLKSFPGNPGTRWRLRITDFRGMAKGDIFRHLKAEMEMKIIVHLVWVLLLLTTYHSLTHSSNNIY